MDMEKVVDGLYDLIITKKALCCLPGPGRMTNQQHLLWMLEQIQHGEVTGEKAHRWVGYVQGVLVALHVTSVEEMRDLNR